MKKLLLLTAILFMTFSCQTSEEIFIEEPVNQNPTELKLITKAINITNFWVLQDDLDEFDEEIYLKVYREILLPFSNFVKLTPTCYFEFIFDLNNSDIVDSFYVANNPNVLWIWYDMPDGTRITIFMLLDELDQLTYRLEVFDENLVLVSSTTRIYTESVVLESELTLCY